MKRIAIDFEIVVTISRSVAFYVENEKEDQTFPVSSIVKATCNVWLNMWRYKNLLFGDKLFRAFNFQSLILMLLIQKNG
ncbi:hypothetical protein B4W73_06895 [Staphylococcus delphini]|nr:hypothetical protein B5B98_05335 [Staphylococcus delphini]PCF74384.1 hypothetical protein B4W73_06895 [Staphylococcus delphini]